MLRRIAAALAIVAAPLAILAVGDTAARAQDVCAGTGSLTSQRPVYLPTMGPTSFGTFAGFTNTGTCGNGPQLNFSGNYSGDCATVSASGTTNRGDDFNATAVGGIFVFTGEVTGVAEAFPDATQGASCSSGATRFIFNYALQTQSGSITSPTIPPLPGGPAGPSADCDSAIPVRTSVEGEDVKLVVETRGPSVWVCVRVGTDSGFGGKLVVTVPEPDAGWTPPVPYTDSDVDACKDTPGNLIPGTHPIAAGAGPIEHVIDAYAGLSNGVFVCLQADFTSVRVVVPIPGLPPLGNPDADWYPDPGTG